jgi:uncharacterized protein YjbI with pentapeptide repeats
LTTALDRFDEWRKRHLLLYLYGAGLINRDNPIVDLSGADLSGADFSGADLTSADLSGVNLRYANFSDADLSGAYLLGANLSDATVTEEQLSSCKSFREATMPNGQRYEEWLKDKDSRGKDTLNADSS